VKCGPASAMVARETSNLEAAGSSPALGSSSDRSMRSIIFCDFFRFFTNLCNFFRNPTLHKHTQSDFAPEEFHSHSQEARHLSSCRQCLSLRHDVPTPCPNARAGRQKDRTWRNLANPSNLTGLSIAAQTLCIHELISTSHHRLHACRVRASWA
jgi:hypothetical protein